MRLPRRSSPRPPRGNARPRRPQPNGDYLWLEANVLGEGDLLLYGRLAEEFGDLPPEETWKELRAVAEAYLAAGPDRAAIFQRRLDETLAALLARDQRFGYPPPFCHKGCSNCCHELVYCTSEEALRIHRHCLEAGLPVDLAKLERQLRHVETDARGDHTGGTTWNDQEEADQACVFLDPANGACTIWPVRPMVCRAHLAEETAAHCRPHNGQVDPEARGINHLETSYLLSALFTIHRASVKRTMGRLLLELANGSSLAFPVGPPDPSGTGTAGSEWADPR